MELHEQAMETEPLMLTARSLLFVPANKEGLIDEAKTSAADVVVLDLEDLVSAEEKAAARSGTKAAIEKLKAAGKMINRAWRQRRSKRSKS